MRPDKGKDRLRGRTGLNVDDHDNSARIRQRSMVARSLCSAPADLEHGKPVG